MVSLCWGYNIIIIKGGSRLLCCSNYWLCAVSVISEVAWGNWYYNEIFLLHAISFVTTKKNFVDLATQGDIHHWCILWIRRTNFSLGLGWIILGKNVATVTPVSCTFIRDLSRVSHQCSSTIRFGREYLQTTIARDLELCTSEFLVKNWYRVAYINPAHLIRLASVTLKLKWTKEINNRLITINFRTGALKQPP